MAWSLTQNASTDLGTSVSFGSDVTSGSLLVVNARIATTEQNPLDSVSDNINGTWTVAVDDGPNADNNHIVMAYFLNSSSGSITVTPNWTPGGNMRIVIAEFAPPASEEYIVASVSTQTSTTADSGSASGSGYSDILAVGGGISANNVTWTVQGGWSQAASSNRAYLQYDTDVTGGGSYESSPTLSASQINSGGIMLFGVAAGSTPIHFRRHVGFSYG